MNVPTSSPLAATKMNKYIVILIYSIFYFESHLIGIENFEDG